VRICGVIVVARGVPFIIKAVSVSKEVKGIFESGDEIGWFGEILWIAAGATPMTVPPGKSSRRETPTALASDVP